MRLFVGTILLFASCATSAQVSTEGFESWPARTFAPYLATSSPFDATICMALTGLKTFTLTHINADKDGNPAWFGIELVSDCFYCDEIDQIRNAGGDVIVSFGGSGGGTDLSTIAETADDLAVLYQSVIDTYKLTAIDVDIFGSEADIGSFHKRSQALALLQAENPNLRISVTLSVSATGFDDEALLILESISASDFLPDVINLLTLDFEGVNEDVSLGSLTIFAAESAYAKLQELDYPESVMIGVSPMIGANDVADEVFSLSDAAQVKKWAEQTSWLAFISFWSINRDTNLNGPISESSQIEQDKFAFSEIFLEWQIGGDVIDKLDKHLFTRQLDTQPENVSFVDHSGLEFLPGDPSLPEPDSDPSRSTSCSPLVRIDFYNPNGNNFNGARIQDWNRCTQFQDRCNVGMVCCVAPGDTAATCRQAGLAPNSQAGCASVQPPFPNVPAKALPPCAVNFPTTRVSNPLPLLPPKGSYYFGIWWNNDYGDSPQNVNNRVRPNNAFPMWQMNIPMTASALAVNYFDDVWAKPINLNTNAVFFISIFPSTILPYVSNFAIETLAYRLKAIIDTGRNVWVRYAPEMNGNWLAYQQDPVNYVEGYRRFVQVTRAITGTANILFVWSPNVGNGYPWGGVGDPNNPYAPFYPGDEYTDMVGLSIYHFGRWTPSGLYENSLPADNQLVNWIDSFVKLYSHKPFVLSETAYTTNFAAQDSYGNWYTQANSDAEFRRAGGQNWWRQIAAASSLYPSFVGAIIFDYIKNEGGSWRDFTVTGGNPGLNSPIGNDGAAKAGLTLDAFRADVNNGVLRNVLWAQTQTAVAQWNNCNRATDTCATSGDQCCFGSSADFTAGKTTCRPAGNCYGIPDQSTCNPSADVCANSASKCCSGSGADYIYGVTKCLTSCYSLVPQWNNCNRATDTCATSGDQCCFGSSADYTAGKTTCRPTSNCYTPPRPVPVQPDANFQAGYNWGSQIFAPFIDVSVTPAFDVVGFSNNVGSSRYIFGFISAATDGTPAWSGTDSISKLNWLTPMQSIRLFGGDAIISLGGPSGTELALKATSARNLQISYQNVVDGYNVRWLDFFISGAALTDETSINLRNQVLRAMQVANPNLLISYTLPTASSGLTAAALNILTSALNYGVRVDVVNLLSTSTSVATAASTQLQQLGMTTKLGLTPTIGTDSVSGTTFQVTDGSNMVKWAKTNSQMRLLSIWNANRDASANTGVTQRARQFSQTFVQYEN